MKIGPLLFTLLVAGVCAAFSWFVVTRILMLLAVTLQNAHDSMKQVVCIGSDGSVRKSSIGDWSYAADTASFFKTKSSGNVMYSVI